MYVCMLACICVHLHTHTHTHTHTVFIPETDDQQRHRLFKYKANSPDIWGRSCPGNKGLMTNRAGEDTNLVFAIAAGSGLSLPMLLRKQYWPWFTHWNQTT